LTVIHIAASPEDRVQECSRCGLIIADLDSSDERILDQSFWPENAFVAITQSPFFKAEVQPTDARGKDQEKCKALPVDVPIPRNRFPK
jgi:hypothetical protein